MSLKNIETLSLNPHFFKHLISCFLSGYDKPCDLKLIFMVLPILLYAPAREKLATSNSRSRLNTVFDTKIEMEGNIKLSGKTRLAGFLCRYEMLKPATKKSIIILHSQGKISINGRYITLNENISYGNYNDSVKKWMKAAHYLGVVFSNSNADNISFFLGVE